MSHGKLRNALMAFLIFAASTAGAAFALAQSNGEAAVRDALLCGQDRVGDF